ncbi:MAG TPA: hypothetical protein VGT40_18895 [Methylomirabilota bacterium]|nr:hypothetical protein [Methylomirabilota bacterium]
MQDFRLLRMSDVNESIRTSQAAVWFKDSLVVGTGRAPLGFMGRYTARQGPKALAGEGAFGSLRPDTGAREEDGAQVWRFVPATGRWTLAYSSPLVTGRDGQRRARDRSIRAACVHRAQCDATPTLYLGVGSLERQVVFLRSEDGEYFEECAEHGFGLGDVDVPSVRSIVGLDGSLYSTPVGKNFERGMFDDNLTDYPIVFEAKDPRGGWRPVSEAGFGDPENLSINELAVMDGCLYAATINKRGFQIWKAKPEGKPPYPWRRILADGAWRGAVSSFPSVMSVFNGALYVGGTLQRQGRGGRDRFGPFAAEMLRIHPDDTWDLVAGTPRFTPHGLKRPISGMLGGFDDRFTHVFWRMAEYDGWLYIGTAGWKWMPTYLRDRADLSEAQLHALREETARRRDGEFSLWRTQDGVGWHAVTRTGFSGGNPHNYGIRELVSTPVGLFVLPTNKFGARGGGGIEIWWGKPRRS